VFRNIFEKGNVLAELGLGLIIAIVSTFNGREYICKSTSLITKICSFLKMKDSPERQNSLLVLQKLSVKYYYFSLIKTFRPDKND
jgi:hypothetical protein